ncbi:unnamed protein product [Owenia fusiformis]|uniref:Uncharacterized protein n=1 Tax=Owenia fusiformis TaxID=6347 RepID=A0A8J1TLH1_OWEFU|nr:unnamed protein product [Owenia fusiformis]
MPPPPPSLSINPDHEISESEESFVSDDDSDAPCATQTEESILSQIRESCTGLPKPDFMNKISTILDHEEIESTREALYDYARINRPHEMPPGGLIKRSRRNREHKSKTNKSLDDIYVLFNFIEGAGNVSEVKNMLNPKKDVKRKSMATSIANSQINPSNKEDCTTLAHIMELKVNMQKDLSELQSNVSKLLKNKETALAKEVDIKTKELNRIKDTNQQIRNELKLAKQEISTLQETVKELKLTSEKYIQKLHVKLDRIDMKLSQESHVTNKRQKSPRRDRTQSEPPMNELQTCSSMSTQTSSNITQETLRALSSESSAETTTNTSTISLSTSVAAQPSTSATYATVATHRTNMCATATAAPGSTSGPKSTMTITIPTTIATSSTVVSTTSVPTVSATAEIKATPRTQTPTPNVNSADQQKAHVHSSQNAKPSDTHHIPARISSRTDNGSFANYPPTQTHVKRHYVSNSADDHAFEGVQVTRKRSKQILLSHVKSIPYNSLRSSICKERGKVSQQIFDSK